MARNDGIFLLSDGYGPQLSLYKSGFCQPEVFAATLANVLGGYRQKLRRGVARIVPLIVSAEGSRKSGRWEVYPHAEAANKDHNWRYEITIEPSTPMRLKVMCIVDKAYEITYEGTLELFVTRALRNKLPKPRGRTPQGYESRAEYELAIANRHATKEAQKKVPLPNRPWQEEIRDEQRASKINPPDLSNVRVHSKAEALRRLRKARRK